MGEHKIWLCTQDTDMRKSYACRTQRIFSRLNRGFNTNAGKPFWFYKFCDVLAKRKRHSFLKLGRLRPRYL